MVSMKKCNACLFSGVVFCLMLLANDVFAANITVYDGQSSSATGWYGLQEDQEVSNRCVTGQVWDLEAFFLEGMTLSVVGGYDFVNGEVGNGMLFESGDIFLDITGDAGQSQTGFVQSANGTQNVADGFGYEYAIDLDLDNMAYNIIDLTVPTSSPVTTTVYYRLNQYANPWRYVSGGSVIGTGSIQYETGLSDGDTGFLGGSHNKLGVDIGFLGGKSFTSHFTIECGNDNLMGYATAVPEPGIISFMVAGLFCLAVAYRKRRVR